MYALLQLKKWKFNTPSISEVVVNESYEYISAMKIIRDHEEAKEYKDYVEIQNLNEEEVNENELKTYQIVELDS